jgi:hypothetical protein
MCGISQDDTKLRLAFNAFNLEHTEKCLQELWPLLLLGISFLENKVFGIVDILFRSRTEMAHCHYHNKHCVLCEIKEVQQGLKSYEHDIVAV